MEKGYLTNSLDIAKEVFNTEQEAIQEVLSSLDNSFNSAIDLIDSTKGRVVVTGMGKSGHIAAKIAATLASTGTPAFFVHPAEMGHGDLGMLTSEDLVLALSYSGNTEELRKVLLPIKKLGLPLISITAGKNSALAQASNIVLLTPISKEACPLDLAPTSSTTVALVMGDAIAVALMKKRNFQKQDFAKSHPLGSLGRSFVQVSEIMTQGHPVPQVSLQSNLQTILEEIDSASLGFTTVVDSQGGLIGVITDGDLRRAQLKFSAEVFTKTAQDLMNANPKTVQGEAFASRAADLMREYRISVILVMDDSRRVIGILDLKDLLAQGFVI